MKNSETRASIQFMVFGTLKSLMRISRLWLIASAILLANCSGGRGKLPYENAKLPIDKRVDDLTARLTAVEKKTVLEGGPVQRLGIPGLSNSSVATKTVYPSAAAMAATWDTDLMSRVGQGIADESLAAGRRLVPGPNVREFGEDPWLASRMAVAWVSGLQGEGAIAVLRGFGDAYGTADERTLREKLFAPYLAAVEEAGLWAMELPDHDRDPLLETLENAWGFKGFVLNSGDAGNAADELDRRLRAMFGMGAFDSVPSPAVNTEADAKIAQQAFDESFVLLKNDGNILPLSPTLGSIALIGGKLPQMPPQATYVSGASIAEAADLARRSVAAVVFSGNAELIRAVAAQNRNTVAVLDGRTVHVPDLAPAEIISWGSHDIGRVLFGEVSPSGKLPAAIAPQYPFGAGLSYTTFAYSDLKVFPKTPRYGQIVQIAQQVKNTGSRAGTEVVEVYVHQQTPDVGERGPKLKAFRRIALKPGEAQIVSFELDRRAMSFYDPVTKNWATEPGVFDVSVGSSSVDIRARDSFQLYR